LFLTQVCITTSSAEKTIHFKNDEYKQDDNTSLGTLQSMNNRTPELIHTDLRSFIKSTQRHNLAHLNSNPIAYEHLTQDDLDKSQPGCPILASIEELALVLKLPESCEGIFIGDFMSTKKSYEVNILTDLCARLAKRYSISKVTFLLLSTLGFEVYR